MSGIKLLTGTNFSTWRDQVKLTLEVMDLDHALRIDPPVALTAESTADQKRAIHDSKNAKEYLSSVEEQFKGTSKAHASTLILKMLTIKYDRVSGVREHIMMMGDMANKLKGMDMKISEGFLVHFIMTSLPMQFSPFKINYNTQKEKWKMSELIAMCVQEEERLKVERAHGRANASTNSFQGGPNASFAIRKGISKRIVQNSRNAEVKNQPDRKIKVVRSDRGGEYYGRHTDVGQAPGSFFDFCKDHGIINQYTMSGTPQTIKGLPINCPSHITRIVKTRHAEFLENANNSGSGSFRRIELQEARDETLIIHVPISINTPLDTSNDHLIAQDHPNNVEENEPNSEINVEPQETQQPLRRSQRNRQPTNFDDYYTYLNEADFDLGKCNDPESFEDAITCDQSARWREAMEDELNSMSKNNVWELAELPKGAKPIGCKWVYKTKLDPNRNVERYKARLVAKGYTQNEGVNYKETFSPVSRKDSLRIVMALVTHFDLELHQMDVKVAFLNGDLHEDVYMAQQQGFKSKGQEHLVCKLKKSIYGLKQASRQWYLKFDKVMKKHNFIKNQ
nr:putative zinc finger, CCHC-type [Tanacetum cinerariifolium]